MRRTLLFVSVAVVLVLSAACGGHGSGARQSDRTVMLDGKPVHVDDAAGPIYQEAQQRLEEEDVDGAQAQLEQLLDLYPDSRWAELAMVALARIHLDADRPEQAQQLVEGLLVENPTSPVADDARYLLALAQLAQGESDAAAPTLKQQIDKLETPQEQQKASSELAETLEKKGQPTEAAKYWHRSIELIEDPAERQIAEERLLRLVDEELPFAEIRRLAETEAKPGTFFDEVLTYKLARVHLHLRSDDEAKRRLDHYAATYPSGRFAADVEALKVALDKRVQVAPRVVGVVLPLTGNFASYGQRVLTAVKIGFGAPVSSDDYKDDVTGAGRVEVRVKGQEPLVLIVVDSKGDPLAAADAVQQLVEEHHAIAVIGDILLDTSLPVSLRGEELGVPVISLSRREGLPQIGPWSFRMSFTAKKQAKALVSLAMDQMGLKRFGVLYPKHSYGVELMNGFWDEVEARQGEITAIESYGHDQTTFTDEARSMVGRAHLEARGEFIVCKNQARALDDEYRRKKAMERCQADVSPIVDFDALLIPDDYRTVSYILPAFEAEDVLLTRDRYTIAVFRKTTKNRRVKPVQLLGGAMWNDPELGKRLGRKIDGAILVDGFSPRSGETKVTKFVKTFAGAHRSRPGLLEAQAHDAGHLLRAILAGEGGAAPTGRAALRERLARAKDFPGVTGLVGFDKDGDSETPPTYFTFEKGRLETANLNDLIDGEG